MLDSLDHMTLELHYFKKLHFERENVTILPSFYKQCYIGRH